MVCVDRRLRLTLASDNPPGKKLVLQAGESLVSEHTHSLTHSLALSIALARTWVVVVGCIVVGSARCEARLS